MRLFKDIYSFDWDRVFDGAAALTYYFILAIFPGLLVLLSIISYLPTEVINSQSIYTLIQQTPQPISELILSVLNDIQSKKQFGVFSASFLVAIWTANNGVSATIRQLNTAYGVSEKRSYLKVQTTSVFLSLSIGLLLLAPIVSSFVIKYVAVRLPTTSLSSTHFIYEFLEAKYFLFFLLFSLLFQLIYHYGPSVDLSWKKHLTGSLTMAALFAFVTYVFEIYLEKFADYSLIYGSLGTIIILMLWFNILGLLLLSGAELNKKLNT